MTDATEIEHGGDFYLEHVPTFSERAARALGYGFRMGPEPEGHERLMGGWAHTNTTLKFTVLDRLRLLFSGRLRIEHTHYASKPIEEMQSRVDLVFHAPWETKNPA